MLCRAEVTFSQIFHQEYFRNNKTNGSKNIRCFPQCTSCHYKQGFCGQAVFAQLEIEYAPGEMVPDDLTIVGEFQPCSDEFDGIKNTIAESFLVKNSIPPNNRFIIAKTKTLTSSPSARNGNQKLVIELRFEARPWQYSWHGNRFRQATYHAFVVSIMCPLVQAGSGSGDLSNDTTYLKLVNQVASPTFRISCMRRSSRQQQRNVQDSSSGQQIASVNAGDGTAGEFIHLLNSPMDGEESFFRSFEVNDACTKHTKDRSRLPAASPSTPKRTVRSTPVNTVTPVKNARRDDSSKSTSIARTISDIFRSTHTLSALGRIRSPFSLECDAIQLDLGDGLLGDPTTDGSSNHSTTTTVESVEVDCVLEGPRSLSITGRKTTDSPLPLFGNATDENPSELMGPECVSANQDVNCEGVASSQHQSKKTRSPSQPPLPLFRTVGKRELALHDDGSSSDSELITLPKKVCTHTFYSTHNVFKQELTARDAMSVQGNGSFKSAARVDELIVLPTRGKMPVMRRSVALPAPKTPPSPCSPLVSTPRKHASSSRDPRTTSSASASGRHSGSDSVLTSPTVAVTHGIGGDSSSDTPQGTGKSLSVVVHGFPAFPSTKSLDAKNPRDVRAAVTSGQSGATWSPRARQERHSSLLRQLFPDMVFPGDVGSEEAEELV